MVNSTKWMYVGENTLVSKGLTVKRNIEKRTRRSEELHPNILDTGASIALKV